MDFQIYYPDIHTYAVLCFCCMCPRAQCCPLAEMVKWSCVKMCCRRRRRRRRRHGRGRRRRISSRVFVHYMHKTLCSVYATLATRRSERSKSVTDARVFLARTSHRRSKNVNIYTRTTQHVKSIVDAYARRTVIEKYFCRALKRL